MRPIEVSAKIPVAGYVPGQMINLELHVKHKGSEKLYEFTVHLMKVNAKRLSAELELNFDFSVFFSHSESIITQKIWTFWTVALPEAIIWINIR